MPPKNSIIKDNLPSEDEHEPLQAVILADTYNERLKPLTVEKPRVGALCLLPICNTTLLDWTIESLSLAGVQEIFVVCTAHADLIKETLAASKWSQPSSGLKITPIVTATTCWAPGDALRDVYTHGVITSDFILVFGDLVSNVRLDEIVKIHKARRKVDRDAIMTIVVKEAGTEQRSKPLGDGGIFVLDADTNECLYYEAVPGLPLKKNIHIPREIFDKHPNVQVRNDLIDCGIDICSVEVPSLFQDNFDYLDIRRHFVHGILTSDLLDKSIHCHVVENGYAARVKDSKSYAIISNDILTRWTYPLVPDENNPSGQAYEHRRGNVYLPPNNSSVQLSRSCKIGNNTLLGYNTKISDNAQIIHSTLGNNCSVSANAVIQDSYLWDDVIVEDGCVIEQCIIGKGAKILRGSALSRGCLIGDGVILGPNAKLDEFTRVSTSPPVDGEDEGSPKYLGPKSNGIVWPSLGFTSQEQDESDEENETVDELEAAVNIRLLRIGDETHLSDLQRHEPDSSSSSEEDSDAGSSIDDNASTRSSTTSAVEPTLGSKLDAIAVAEFTSEVSASLERAWTEGHTVENAAVELKTLRMASNVPLRRVREAIVRFLVMKIESGNGKNGGEVREQIRKVVGRWGGLIDAIGGVDAVETIEVLQELCAREPQHLSLFGSLLAALYQEDIVEENDVRTWHSKPESRGKTAADVNVAVKMDRCWSIGSRMIEQFDAQDSDDEDSDE
ncbi:hypothetical protein Clacol_006294 [Clathrus columnatus]|uniref:Translation initiation factor eIF2B subunit epsilon n=1 Tax=Clathrus columnatus TaxID=1419009 RepID=A0AAV5AFZ9_9AGAM|nr:hypothetical protein Clacol_006294 [Clathrus columnatus]